MNFNRLLPLVSCAIAGIMGLTSCNVEQDTASSTRTNASGAKKKTSETTLASDSWAEKMKAAREEREKQQAASDKEKAKELAAKKKADEAEARKLAAEKKKEEAEKAALAERKAKEKEAREAAEKKAREERLARQKKEREDLQLARTRDSERRSTEVAAVANRDSRGSGGGFFSSLSISTPSKYKSKGHHVDINNRLLESLNASNARIEIDLSEQRARVYKTGGGQKQLVIETQISTGKSGHSTPTGTYRISEKLVQKRSSRYGSWVNSSGATVRSSGDSTQRPAGASTFVGAEMPYWMRVNGGIGMHIGYVPDGPASHGCIRVPSPVQPLIYSKVGVGTPVVITH